MDFRDKVFICVAEHLNFTKAASELFISQPAVTKHIKELEEKLGVLLFERKGNKIYLTQAGKLSFEHLKKIRNQYQELEYELSRLQDDYKGILKIGASSTISQYLIPAVMADFHFRYPDIKLDLLNGNSFEMEQKLIQNEIDLALVENESINGKLNYSDFMDDELLAVTGSQSSFAKRKRIQVSELSQIPIALREKGSGTLQVIENQLQIHNVDLNKINVHIHLGSTEAIKNFLLKFNGIALVSERAIQKELLLNSLVILKIDKLEFNRKFRIVQSKSPASKIQKLFINFLLNYNF